MELSACIVVYNGAEEALRAAHRSLKPFLWQLRSLLRYFSKWGFAW